MMLFTVFPFRWKTQLCGKHKTPLGNLGLGAEQGNAQRSEKDIVWGYKPPSLSLFEHSRQSYDTFEVSGRSLSQSNRIRALTFSIAAPKSCIDQTRLIEIKKSPYKRTSVRCKTPQPQRLYCMSNGNLPYILAGEHNPTAPCLFASRLLY